MPISFDPSQRPPKRLQETFWLFGMDDCTPATAIGQPEVAPIANFLRRQRSAPVLMWTILDIINAGVTTGFQLLIALIIRQ